MARVAENRAPILFARFDREVKRRSVGSELKRISWAEDLGLSAARNFPGMPMERVACPYLPMTKLYHAWTRGFKIGRAIDRYSGTAIILRGGDLDG